jgi:hypothetical protein
MLWRTEHSVHPSSSEHATRTETDTLKKEFSEVVDMQKRTEKKEQNNNGTRNRRTNRKKRKS